MTNPSRRSLLRGSLAIAAGAGLARPYLANAAATTASAWWAQGFAQEEDVALRKIVADYEKASGNTIDLSIVPFAPLRQKIISAMTSGTVPDLIDANPLEVVPEEAWNGRLVDVSDVVETQKSHYLPNALLSARCYDNVKKQRSYYGVPYKASVRPFHYWRDLVVKAGYKESDIPNTWNAFIDFFKPVQQKLRDAGMRHVYATGFVLSTVG
ncbi:MAG: extracellular solute-binding protein, partial [Stellaceae bacterium]